MTDDMVWNGPEPLRPFLVAIADLEPWTGNPRHGDVAAVRQSLERFGQQRPIVVHGDRIVAGHHIRLAAVDLGFTHVAAIPNTFADDEEARAYMLADNRVHDLGPGYDTEALVGHLRELADLDALDGTGYTTDDLDGLLAELANLGDPPAPREPREPLPPSEIREVALMFGPEQLDQFNEWVRVLAERTGTAGVSETVYEALRIATTA